MSKTVDERIVEMRFDNSNFETNVKTSLNTLERLKSSMNFDKASESLKSIDKAANSVSLGSIATDVSALSDRFSVLGIMGKRALENITDSIMRFGKKLTSFLTSGIISGGIKRAMNLENAHFQLQGLLKDEEAVAAVMQDVNYAVDGTAYSLDAAAKVASQLAASGMRAGDQMKNALRGVAGVAAMTNSSYEDIGRIFTQVAGQGRLMGQDLLQLSSRGMNAAATIAEYLGITESEVRSLVTKGEISFEIFANAMDSAFGEHAKKANETFSGAMSNVKASLARIGAEFVSPLIEQNGPLVQLLNTFRERINELKSTIGPLADIFTGFINNAFTGLSKVVGKMDWSKPLANLKGLNSKWDEFTEKLTEAGVTTDQFKEKLTEIAAKHNIDLDKMIEKEGSLASVMESGSISKKMIIQTLKDMSGAQKEVAETTVDYTDKLEYFQEVVRKVWQGDYKNGEERIKALTEAGYDYAQVQDLINKTVDDHTVSLEDLTDAQLENIGYTEEEVTAIRALADEAAKAGTPVNELISSLEKPSGKELMIEALHNILRAIIDPLRAFGRAWKEIFTPKSSAEVYSSVEAFKKFTDKLVMSESTMDKLTRTFKGFLAIIDLVTTITGGAFKFALNVVCEVLGITNVSVLTLTAYVGDAIVAFHNWVKQHSLLARVVKTAVKAVATFVGWIIKLVKYLYKLPIVQNGINKIAQAFTKVTDSIGAYFGEGLERIAEFIEQCKELDGFSLDNVLKAFKNFRKNVIGYFFDFDSLFDKIPEGLISGFVNGLKEGITKVAEVVLEIGKTIIDTICDFLGIHSPSTKAIEIGENTIQGLIIGLKSGIGGISGVMGAIGDAIIDGLKNIDFGKVAVVGLVGGTVFGGMKVATQFIQTMDKLLTPILSPLQSVSKLLNTFGTAITNVSNAVVRSIDATTFRIKADAIFTLAKSIALLAAAIWLLSKINWPDLGKAALTITFLTGVLYALTVASAKAESMEGFGKLAGLLLSFAVSLLIMSSAVKKIAKLDPDDAERAMEYVSILMAGMIVLIVLAGKFVDADKGGSIAKAGIMFIELAAAIGMMAIVLRMLGNLPDKTNIKVAIGMLLLIGGVITGMIAATKLAGKHIAKAGTMFMEMAVALGMLAIVIRMLGNLEWGQIQKGLTVIGYVGVVFTALVAVSKFAGKHAARAGTMLLQMGVAIGILALAIQLMGNLSMKQVSRGLSVIEACMTLFLAFILLSEYAGKRSAKAGKMLMQMSIGIGVLAVAIRIISSMSLGDIAKGIGVIAAIGVIFALLTKMSQYAGKDADKAGKMFMQMSISILVLAGAIAILSLLSVEDIAKATLAIDSLLVAYALILKFSGNLKSDKGNFKNLIAMTVVIALLGASLIILSQLDPASVTVATACLISLMGMFGMLIKTSEYAKGSLKSILAIAGVIAVLSAALYLIAQLPVKRSLGAAVALSTLMITLAASLRIISTVKTVSKDALVAVYALTGVVAILAVILGALTALNVAPSLETALALSSLLVALALTTVILAGVGAAAEAAIIGALAMDGVIVAIGALVVGIGALFTKVKGLEPLLDKGIEIMKKLFRGLGGVLSSFGVGLTDGLDEVGTNLSNFMENLGPFIEGAKAIPSDIGDTIYNLGVGLSALTSANLKDKFTNWAFGEDSLASFGEQLSSLGDSLLSFAESVSGVSAYSDDVYAAIDILNTLTEIDPNNTGGLVSLFTGDNSLSGFGIQLTGLGSGLKSFSESVSGVSAYTDDVHAAIDIINTLTEIDPNNTGGLVSLFTGDNSLDNFGAQVTALGSGLASFAESVGGIETDFKKVKQAVKIANALSEIKPSKSGGLVWLISGTDDLTTFGGHIKSFGEGLASFSTSVADIKAEKMEIAVDSAKKLAKITKVLSNEVDDVSSLSTFGSSIADLAEGLGGYCNKIAEIKMDNLSGSLDQLSRLKDFMVSLNDFNGSGLSTFTTALSGLATDAIDNFVLVFTNSYEKASTAATGLMDAVKSGMNTGFGSVTLAFMTMITGCITTLNTATSKFREVGVTCITKFSNGLKAHPNKPANAIKTIKKACTEALKGIKDTFYKYGANAAKGFASGIRDNAWRATARAAAMARAAMDAAKKELDINSPSKEFKKIGMGIPEGMALGIEKYTKLSTNAAKSMAIDVMDSANAAVASLSNSNFDVQPTIRPVVDMDSLQLADLQFNANMELSLNRPMQMLSDAMYGSQSEIVASNKEVVDSINNLKSNIVSGVKEAIRDVFNEIESEPIIINSHLNIDGKEFANSQAANIQNATNKLITRANRKSGIL